MKGHKEHHHKRSTGGMNDAVVDLDDKPEARTNAKKIDGEAEERAHGGKVEHGRKHGEEHHHPSCKCKKCHGGRAERKSGGRLKEGFGPEMEATHRAHGGVVHHEKMEHLKHAKHIGKVHGEEAKHHAGHKPRKSGGRAEANVFSAAHKGSPAEGHKTDADMN